MIYTVIPTLQCGLEAILSVSLARCYCPWSRHCDASFSPGASLWGVWYAALAAVAQSYPKQFVELTGDESLYQASARRLSGPGFAAPTIVTAADFRFIVIEQLAALEILPADILIEPAAKNTAAAICAAALALEARESGALMLVAPSDHVIPEAERFQAAVAAAAPTAQAGRLVTFGIRPDRPETGYGWLELSTPLRTFRQTLRPTFRPSRSRSRALSSPIWQRRGTACRWPAPLERRYFPVLDHSDPRGLWGPCA